MKRTVFTLLFLLSVVGFTAQKNGGVYICTGGYSTKYHAYSTCRGLNNCQANVVKISIAEAVEKGRSACSICY